MARPAFDGELIHWTRALGQDFYLMKKPATEFGFQGFGAVQIGMEERGAVRLEDQVRPFLKGGRSQWCLHMGDGKLKYGRTDMLCKEVGVPRLKCFPRSASVAVTGYSEQCCDNKLVREVCCNDPQSFSYKDFR